MARIVAVRTVDVRFPTSRTLDGSDAMNPDPDYSAATIVLETDQPGLAGHGLAFTIGRGNQVQVAAIEALTDHIVGREVESLVADLGGFARELGDDSQLRWLGPEKGVIQMAIGAAVNAAWDLAGRVAGLPVWQLIGSMSPEAIADLIDFRYLSDALDRDDALAILRDAEPGRADRVEALLANGYPAYTTSPGWLGYSDDKLARLCREAVADGFGTIKLKVGLDLADDRRRLAVARDAVGPDVKIAIDANQRWDTGTAIEWLTGLAEFEAAWIEEPTSPDDILAHAAIRRAVSTPVSTGEHTQNRIVFKQLFQAGAVDLIQIDAARVGGVNENLAILLLAAKFGVPVYPHAGGVGLCEMVQHLAMADFVAISGRMDDRSIEFVDHLHEHFTDPVSIVRGRYRAPSKPGLSAQMYPESVSHFTFPDGPGWLPALDSDLSAEQGANNVR